MAVIWALARNTIAQAVRMKSALALIALFLLLAPVAPFVLEGDGTQVGKLQVVLTYSVTLAAALLTVLTVLLSSMVLDSEIQNKQIHLLVSKPVRRWQLLVGKWLGVVLLNAWMLLLMGVIIICSSWYFARLERARPEGFLEVRERILTSRASFRPEDPDPMDLMRRYRKNLIESGRMTAEEFNQPGVMREMRKRIERRSRRVDPGQARTVVFENVPKPEDPDVYYTIRYKLYGVEERKIRVLAEWRLASETAERAYALRTRSKSGEDREFHFPADAVGDDGRLEVTFINLTFGRDPSAEKEKDRKPNAVSFSLGDGLELLAPSGSFSGNIARAFLLLLVRLAFLAAVGVCASALLTAPVTVFLLVAVVAYGHGRDFIAANMQPRMAQPTELELEAGKVAENVSQYVVKSATNPVRAVVRWVSLVFPNFSDTDPVPDLVVGREIGWETLAVQTWWYLVLRGGVVFALGAVAIYLRELGLPST